MSPKTTQPFTVALTLLGLVRQQPLHGYEIYQQLKNHALLSMLWMPKQAQVYALLRKLEQAGLLAATVETQQAYPPRRILHLTEDGLAAFSAWISNPVTHWDDVQQEFLLKLFFAQQAGGDTALRLVERQRRQSRQWLVELHNRLQTLTACQSSAWLLIELRQRQIEGLLEWLDRCAVHFTDPIFVAHTIAALTDSPYLDLAQRFVDFVCSADGQAILARHGFLPPNETLAATTLLPASLPPIAVPAGATLTVFAAITLMEAFQAIAYAFSNAHNGITVNLTFAGSGHLADELAHGAAADVFATANGKLMNPLIEAGRIAPGSERVFARNRLVVVTSKRNPAHITTFRDLAQPGLKIALGTGAAAIGHYTRDMLAQAERVGSLDSTEREAVLQNVAFYEQDVRAVLGKVVGGEADVGIVFSTDYRDASGVTTTGLVYPLEEGVLQCG